MELRRFGRWIKRVMKWLVWEPRLFWLSLIGPFVIFFGTCVLADALGKAVAEGWEPRIRLTGMFLQLVGFVTVVWGLRNTGRQFGQPSLIESTRNWLGRFPSLRPVYSLTAGMASGSSMVMSPARLRVFGGKTVEARLIALEQEHTRLLGEFDAFRMEVEDKQRSLHAAVTGEAEARETQDQTIRDQLRSAMLGGIHLNQAGVAYFVLGTLGTASQEISALLP